MTTDKSPTQTTRLDTVRVLVCGGREFTQKGLLNRVLNEANTATPIDVIIQGAALGADRLAAIWAIEHGITVLSFPADWSTGRNAGPARNQKMIEIARPQIAFAFPGGRGTADMVRRLKAAAIPVFEVPRNYGETDDVTT